MRPITFSFPTQTQNEITAAQATAASGAVIPLNGTLSNIAQINSPGYIPVVAFPGVQRTAQIFSTGNISTSTFTITGVDIRNIAVSTTLAGPTGTALPVHTTQEFARITSISLGNTLASSPFTIGVGASGSTNYIMTDIFANPFNMTIAVITGTSGPVTVQDSPDNANDPNVTPTLFNHATLVGVLANQESNYAYPVRFVRAILLATAAATSVANITFIQAGT